jgi:hypothetical protein
MGRVEVHTGFLVGKPEGRRPLERHRYRWEGNIKMDIREVRWGHGLDRCSSEYGSCECGNEPPGSVKFDEFLD